MIYPSHTYEFPGLYFELRCAGALESSPAPAAELAALRALAIAVEPTVVEAIDEANAVFQLVAGDARGGAYKRDPEGTRIVERIDGDVLAAWFAELARARTIVRLSIADGWYAVDAHEGDAVRVAAGPLPVVARDDHTFVLAPSPSVIDAAFRATLKPDEGKLELEVMFSAWTEANGPGYGPLRRMLAALTAAGWSLTKQPAPDSARVPAPPLAPVIPLPVKPRTSAAAPSDTVPFVAVPAAHVVLGLTEVERDALVVRLVAIDRAATEAEESLGYRPYNEPLRRGEIRDALAPSLGHVEVAVAAFSIHRRPVTNAMWRAFMTATSAARPTAWPATGTPPADEPVAGVSPSEAAAFAAHYGWALPSEAEWQLAARAGLLDDLAELSEYTRDAFAPYPGGPPGGDPTARCARNSAPRAPACIESRRGVAPDHRFKYARFRCVRR